MARNTTKRNRTKRGRAANGAGTLVLRGKTYHARWRAGPHLPDAAAHKLPAEFPHAAEQPVRCRAGFPELVYDLAPVK